MLIPDERGRLERSDEPDGLEFSRMLIPDELGRLERSNEPDGLVSYRMLIPDERPIRRTEEISAELLRHILKRNALLNFQPDFNLKGFVSIP
jgi:hypothetical protein